MTHEEMDAMMEAHYRAEAEGDLEASLATFHPDIEHDIVGSPTGAIHGVEAVRARYTDTFESMRIIKMTDVHRNYGPDFVVGDSLAECKILKTMMGLPGNNRVITFRILHVFEFADGKIRREQVWLDTNAIRRQLSAPAT